ncbi:uncharacterized protein LOC119742822 [Patiria miniata]|uniref:Core-binding (CB) domain-containing protein n=1 Tax=Patiria miniata TaxID=46514 RepID=A0A914BHM1_PATMI|nr:uncharacterized protein LOC119742822 [Patiria miniata]
MVTSSGAHGKYGGHSPVVQTKDATHSAPSSCPLSAKTAFNNSSRTSRSRYSTTSTLVAESIQPQHRSVFHSNQTENDLNNGCFQPRLGGASRHRTSCGELEPRREGPPYQRSRAAGCQKSTDPLPAHNKRSCSASKVRQLHRCLLHKPSRRHTVPSALSSHLGSPNVVHHERHNVDGTSHCWQAEPHGRCSLQGENNPDRMDATSNGSPEHFSKARSPAHRSVCISPQQPSAGILRTKSRSPCVGNGRPFHKLDKHVRIRISTNLSPSEGPEEDRVGSLQNNPHRPILASSALVSEDSQSSDSHTNNTPSEGRSSCSTPLQNSTARARDTSPDVLAIVEQSLRTAGLSANAATIAAQSRRASTRQSYNSRLRHYYKWCRDKSIDPSTASVGQISDFLMERFTQGLSVSTVRGYRSAIAAVHTGFSDGSTVSNSILLKHLHRGMFVSRPPQQRLVPSWDLGSVLSALTKPPYEPLANASLLNLTLKTIFLIAAATARRRSELHALTIEQGHVRWEPHGVRLIPHKMFLAKNQSSTFQPSDIFIPEIKTISSVRDDKLWCPVRALKWYCSLTKPLRGETNQLFITTTQPYSGASRDTISRWIVRTINSSVPDWPTRSENTAHAHDTKALTTSWAFLKGVPLPNILQAAAWKTPSTFVSCYLKDVLCSEGQAGQVALSAAMASHPNHQDRLTASNT